MHYKKEARGLVRSDSGVSAVTGTLLMVALTVVLASVVFYLVASLETPQNLTKTSMKILAFNSSTLGITSMVGDSIPIDNVNIIVGPDTYNASGINDANHNGLWDPGETIFLYGLELARQTSVVVSAGSTVVMPGAVQWSYNVPADTGGAPGGTFTSYQPGIRMTTFSQPSYTNPVSARVAPSINYASAEGVASGWATNDPAWPQSDTAGKAHNFSMKFEGYLNVDENCTYRFYITASDSVDMLVDDVHILGATGDHAPTVREADHYLSTGYHKIEIDYQNNNEIAMIGELYVRKLPGGTYMSPGLFYQESTNA